jgi:HD-like signal output (HDOD) protein/ActR/RegA family two-component response regulator
MPTRILFVDDDANVLSGLRRMLHSMRDEWEMAFAESGAQALQILEGQHHDVIVSDMRMPQMDGAQLLAEVRRRHPETVRIILSGYSDHEMILRSIGPTHQYLTKPCEPGVLRSTIGRALALSHLLADARIKAVVGQLEALPSMPALLTQLTEELQRPSCSLQMVGDIISKDVGMTTRILHLVNSAFFGLRREISSPAAAVTYLGLNTVVSLITTFHIFRQVDESSKALLELDRLWEHSMNTGVVAKAIAKAETGDKKLVEDAFAAGLMHDAGRLVLGTNFPQQYRKVMDLAATTKRPLFEVELEVFGATHAEVGAYLVGLWGLPNSITEGLAYHHRPQDCVARAFCPLTAVHAACALDHLLKKDQACGDGTILDVAYLSEIGLEEKVDAWTDLAEEALQIGEQRP